MFKFYPRYINGLEFSYGEKCIRKNYYFYLFFFFFNRKNNFYVLV